MAVVEEEDRAGGVGTDADACRRGPRALRRIWDEAEIARGDRYMTLFAIPADGAMALIEGRPELA
jgi:hypothetical protein